MDAKEIRNLSTEEIIKKIENNKEELFNLRFSQATGNLEKPSRIPELRKEIARMKTVIRERESNFTCAKPEYKVTTSTIVFVRSNFFLEIKFVTVPNIQNKLIGK